MPIKNVVVNCTDVQRSTEFYSRFLELDVIGEPTAQRAVLDAVTATIELRAVGNGREQSTWSPDDLQKGFRHIGFKVDRIDERAAVLKDAGVEFKLDPLDAEGNVRICFFYDPDGTLLELSGRSAYRRGRGSTTSR
jgi:catechol 2,3-dioxygenase-like lactoylglutathione lyase family enzyme